MVTGAGKLAMSTTFPGCLACLKTMQPSCKIEGQKLMNYRTIDQLNRLYKQLQDVLLWLILLACFLLPAFLKD